MPGISAFIRPAAMATGRGTVWPPEEDEEDKESIIVSESTISQGKLEREMQRGMSIAGTPVTTPEQQSPAWMPKNNGEAMGTIGAELNDPNVEKDPAWWQKALGWLEPLKYMDIPIELAAEAVFDPISMATGRDLSWVRGTAEREPFEAWDALFSSDDISPETGFGEVLARMDEAAAAFEKRPLMAQLGLGAVQIAASFGAAGYAKAAQVAGQSMLRANAVRTGAMILDPWEPAFMGVRAAWRGGRRIVRPMSGVTDDGVSKSLKQRDAALNGPQYKLHIVEDVEEFEKLKIGGREAAAAHAAKVKAARAAGKPLPVIRGFADEEVIPYHVGLDASPSEAYRGLPEDINVRADRLFGHDADRYGIGDTEHIIKNLDEGGHIAPDIHLKANIDGVAQEQLPQILKVGNQLRHFIRDNIEIARREVKGAEVPMGHRLEAARKAFAVQLALSVGSRKNHLFKADMVGLLRGDTSLIDSGLVNYFDIEGRGVVLNPLDIGEAQTAAEIYKTTLERWALNNEELIHKATNKVVSDTEWAANPLWWIKDEDQILAFDIDKATRGASIDEWFGFGKKKEASEAWSGESDTVRNVTLDDILKEASEQQDDMQNLVYGLMPTDSRLIRNIRITELVHEFNRFENVAYQMRHASSEVSPIYIRNIPFLGEGSALHKLWSKAAEIRDRVLPNNPVVVSRIEAAAERAKAVSPLGAERAKGARFGGAERTRIGMAILDAYRSSDVGREILKDYQPSEWTDRIKLKRDSGVLSDSEYAEVLNLAEAAADLHAVVALADNMKQVSSYASNIKKAIYKNRFAKTEGGRYAAYRKAIEPHSKKNPNPFNKALFEKPGLLNRAGYFIENGEWHFAGKSRIKLQKASKAVREEELAIDLKWMERRERLRIEMALPAEQYGFIGKGAGSGMVEGAEKRWVQWAQDNYDQIGHANKAIAGTKLKIKGIRGSHDIVEHLLEAVDMSSWDLFYKYGERLNMLPDSMKQDLGFDRLFAGLISEPVSRQGKSLAKGDPIQWKVRGILKKKQAEINRLVNVNPVMNIVYDGFPENSIEAMARFKEIVPDSMLKEWIDDENVISLFKINRITGSESHGELLEKIRKMAQLSPRMFGDDFAEFAVRKKLKKGKKAVGALGKGGYWTPEGLQFLDDLATRLSNHRELWTKIEAQALIGDVPSEIERIMALKPIRASIRGLEGHTDKFGNDLDGIVGNINTVPSIIARIDTMQGAMGKAFNEWINKDALLNKVLRNVIVAPLATVFAGGMAGIARPLTRVFSSRAHAYAIADAKGSAAATALHRHAVDQLGLQADELTESQIAMSGGKARQGMEFLTKLKVHDDIDAILKFEASDEARAANRRFIPKSGISGNGGVAHRLRRMLNLGEYASTMDDVYRRGKSLGRDLANDKDIPVPSNVVFGEELLAQYGDEAQRINGVRKYLTQTDVVLERIDPEHWHNYFEGMVEIDKVSGRYVKTKLWKDLAFLRESINVMDGKLRANGIDIPKITQDRQADYLERYFPRMYYDITASTVEDASGVLTNGAAKHFQSREYEDIVDIIGMSMGTHSHRSGAFMLRPMGERAGMYMTSMHKMMIDKQTVDWVKAQRVVIEGNEFVTHNKAEEKGLNALKGLIDGKLAGLAEPNAQNLETFKAAIGSIDASALKGLGVETFNDPTALANLTEETAKPYHRAIQERLYDLANDYSNKVGQELGGPDLDWLKGSLNNVSAAEQKAVMQYIKVSGNWFQKLTGTEYLAKGLKTPTNVMRYLKSGLDLGAPMIHGYNSLVRLPFGKKGVDLISQKGWLKATKEMASMFWDPDRYDEFLAKNIGVMDEAGNYVRYSTPEPLMAMDDKNFMAVRDWATKNLPKHKHAKFLSRFESGFSGYLDVLRTELWTAMKVSVDNEIDDMFQAAQKAGQPFDIAKIRNEQYHDLGATINKMTGAFDPHLSQQTPFQTLVENSLFFFAPMYRRATFGILADIFRPRGGKTSIRREQALRQLSGVVAVGAGMAMLAEMTGNNPRGFLFDREDELGRGEGELDITARFGKFNAHGVQFGIGTAWWTAFRTASDIAMMAARDKRPIDDSKHWSEHPVVTMLGRRGRSQMAPGAALMVDIFSGRNFIGEPLRDKDENNYAAIMQHMGKSAIPFWLDGLLVGNSVQGTAISGSAEFLGLQSYQQSSYDKLARARQDAIIQTDIPEIVQWKEMQIATGKRPNYVSMPKSLQNILNTNETNVNLLLAEHNEKYGQTATGIARDLRAYMEEKSQADLLNVQKLATMSRAVETGQADYRALQQVLTSVAHNRRVNGIVLLQKYPSLGQYFSDLREGRAESESHFQGDIIYDQWQAMRHSEDFMDEEGRWLGEKAAEAEAIFWMDPQRAQFKEYAINRSNEWFADLPTVKGFDRAKDIIRESGYWDIEDTLWAPGSSMNMLARKFLKIPQGLRDTAKQNNPQYSVIEKQISHARQRLVGRNRMLDEALVTYYDRTPRHPANRGLEERLYMELVGGLPVTPKHTDFAISTTGRITSKQLTGIQ